MRYSNDVLDQALEGIEARLDARIVSLEEHHEAMTVLHRESVAESQRNRRLMCILTGVIVAEHVAAMTALHFSGVWSVLSLLS